MSDKKYEFDEFRDPDYAVTIKIEKEDDELSPEQRSEKVKSIVKREFQNEIENKQESLLLIDERLLEARKLFHRLRYAIVNNFYNTKKFELNDEDIKKEVSFQTDPVAKSEVHVLLTNEQKRIHPAVKETISEKLTDDVFDLSAQRPLRKRFKLDVNSEQHLTIAVDFNTESLRPVSTDTESYNTSNGSNSLDQILKKEKLSSNDNDVVKAELKKPMYIEPKGLDNNVLMIDSSSRNKQKQKFRIIIGNTSKYIEPHSTQDRVTHRWLLYIRGPPVDPDISHILDYVTVQLHDSYIPHNIIKIKSHPFHLSRRGWGEFPVKLRLHFKNEKLNKPVNLIHNLKLDRLHTGFQTLGGEIVVDVWLYTDEYMIGKNGTDSDKPNEEYRENGASHDKTLDDSNDCLNVAKTELIDDRIEARVKIKDEPMDVDDEYEDGDFNDDEMLEMGGHNYVDSKICDTSYSDRDLLTLSRNNFVFKDPSNIHCGDFNLYSSSNSVDSNNLDLTKNHAYSNFNVSILKSIYNDHCYSNNMTVSVDLFNTSVSKLSSVEADTMLELHKTVGLNQIILWYNKLNLGFVLDNETPLTVGKIIDLNKATVEKLSNINVRSIGMLIHLKNIITVNKVIISYYMKELASTVWNSNKGNSEDVIGIVNVLSDMSSANEVFLDLKISKDDGKSSVIRKVILRIESLIQDLNKIVDARCFVNTMLKGMPMINELTRFFEFQRLYPYEVLNVDKFFSLHLIKRRNLQWTRAKMIHEFMKKFYKTPSTIWSTKQILIFGQYHGYYPVREVDTTNISNGTCMLNDDMKTDEEKIELKETFRNSLEINTKTVYSDFENSSTRTKNDTADEIDIKPSNAPLNDFCYISDSSDDEIDICDEPDALNTNIENKKAGKIQKTTCDFLPIENVDEKVLCQYIERTCSSLGIVLRNQSIGHNYTFGLVHKLILSAMKSFVEDVLRRSLAVKAVVNSKVSKNINDNKESMALSDLGHPSGEVLLNQSQTSTENITAVGESTSSSFSIAGGKIWKTSESANAADISLRHIFEALKTRKEFDFITNFGLGQEPSQYTGQL